MRERASRILYGALRLSATTWGKLARPAIPSVSTHLSCSIVLARESDDSRHRDSSDGTDATAAEERDRGSLGAPDPLCSHLLRKTQSLPVSIEERGEAEGTSPALQG